ncbi:alpha-tocopherol transfer protein-like [Babylonia areolata]|uniref:alpha-tocopherol transfer protein-like n=1 Tax=Babylonia areolata TaxID=304850 RepID=UPI003FD215E0
MAKCGDFEYTCTLSEETLEVAKKELNEDPCTRLLEIKTLRDRLQQYPGLKSRLDPQFLIRFLRARKFDQERAFELVLTYYRTRKEDPAIFTGLKPSSVTHVYASHIAFPHPHRDRMGRKIYFIYPARIDTSHYSVVEVFKTEFLNLNKMIEDEENQVRGFTVVLDYKDFGMSNFLQLSTDLARRIARMWQDAFPARLKNVLVVNEPPFVDMVLALFTQFAKAKLVSRVRRIGTDWNRLHEYIDPGCLPAQYGGTLQEEADPQGWVEEMLRSDREMEEDGRFGLVDFTLQGPAHTQDAFGTMAGTFKKLSL